MEQKALVAAALAGLFALGAQGSALAQDKKEPGEVLGRRESRPERLRQQQDGAFLRRAVEDGLRRRTTSRW